MDDRPKRRTGGPTSTVLGDRPDKDEAQSPSRTDDVLVDHLPVDVRAALRFFAFYIANGTLDVDLLEGIDYRPQLMAFGSPLEQVFAIFANVLQVDENGEVLNEGDAQYRAAQ